jgi:hypothetical protein
MQGLLGRYRTPARTRVRTSGNALAGTANGLAFQRRAVSAAFRRLYLTRFQRPGSEFITIW